VFLSLLWPIVMPSSLINARFHHATGPPPSQEGAGFSVRNAFGTA